MLTPEEQLRAALAERDKRIAELETALRPFAQPERNSAYSDESHELISVTSGDLRRARAVLRVRP